MKILFPVFLTAVFIQLPREEDPPNTMTHQFLRWNHQEKKPKKMLQIEDLKQKMTLREKRIPKMWKLTEDHLMQTVNNMWAPCSQV